MTEATHADGVRTDGVTPEDLSRRLAGRFPGILVTAVEIEKIIPGTATKLRLCVRHELPGAPTVLWLKGGLEAHSAAFRELYATEARFYRDVGPHLGRVCADSYHASDGASDGTEMELPLLLLEDLEGRNVRFGAPARPLSAAVAGQVLEVLARVHATAWGSDALSAYPWLTDSHAVFSALIEQWTDAPHWQAQMALPRGDAVPAQWRGEAGRIRVRYALRQMLETYRAASPCLIHGDAHIGNLFIEPDGSVGYLDWQTVRRGPWSHDAAELLVTALEPSVRHQHERELIRRYLQALVVRGLSPPSFESAWQAYRQALMWGFMWVLCPTQLQPEEVCVLNAARACAAMTQLDVLSSF